MFTYGSMRTLIHKVNFNGEGVLKSHLPPRGGILASAVMLLGLALLSLSITVMAGPREQAKRIHDRLTGIPPDAVVLDQMAALIVAGDVNAAAQLAMENPAYYSVTLKNWITPWTNEEADVFAPLNDYTATVIGMARDDIDFRQILSGDVLYVAKSNANLPSYSTSNNNLYQAMDDGEVDLKEVLEASTQSQITGLPVEATAGVMTTRAAAKAFFKDGTNRAMFRFTLINHMCTDLEALKDISRAPDRIRQDVSRSPGGDSRIFLNSCIGCHSGMDPMAQAFAYYNYNYDVEQDPDGEVGALQYLAEGQVDPQSNSRVQSKYHINSNNFPYGFITPNDNWQNYWRQGLNKNLGWDNTLADSGSGAKSMGVELANSRAFAQCQVTKVFKNVCLRTPQDSDDRSQIDNMVSNFASSGYKIKQVFADAADYCKGE
jgi:hypothetical protein